MKRLTIKKFCLCKQDDEKYLPRATAWHDRLCEIEDILGDEYDLDRLRELVESDKGGRI